MSPELQKQLADMLAKLTDATQGAATWTAGQISPLIQEKIRYGRIQSLVFSVLFTGMAVYAGLHGREFYRLAAADKLKNTDYLRDWFERPGGLASIGSGIVTVAASIGAIVSIDTACLAWFAPRLYIVEWLKEMVTK